MGIVYFLFIVVGIAGDLLMGATWAEAPFPGRISSCESFVEMARSTQGLSARDLLAIVESPEPAPASVGHALVGQTLRRLSEKEREDWIQTLRLAAQIEEQSANRRFPVIRETSTLFRKIKFAKFDPRAYQSISPNLFYWDQPPFELMDTPVTRYFWHQVMGSGPKEDPEFLPDDLPVTMFTQEEMYGFLRGLWEGLKNGAPWLAHLMDHDESYNYELPLHKPMAWLSSAITENQTHSSLHDFRTKFKTPDDHPDMPVGRGHPLPVAGEELYDALGYVTTLVLAPSSLVTAGDRFAFWGGNRHSVYRDFLVNTSARRLTHNALPDVFKMERPVEKFSPRPFGGLRLMRRKKFAQ